MENYPLRNIHKLLLSGIHCGFWVLNIWEQILLSLAINADYFRFNSCNFKEHIPVSFHLVPGEIMAQGWGRRISVRWRCDWRHSNSTFSITHPLNGNQWNYSCLKFTMCLSALLDQSLRDWITAGEAVSMKSNGLTTAWEWHLVLFLHRII